MGVASNGTPEAHDHRKVTSRFYSPPSEFDGCFTTFYHFTLDVPDGEVVHDHLQPEWANLRFFSGSSPSAQIAGTQVSGARFGATGPSSLPCAFEITRCRMWGIGLLPVGWARFIDVEADTVANAICDGSQHPAFAKFDVLSDVLCDPEISAEEQYEFLFATLGTLMRHNRDEPKIAEVHAALVSGDYTTVGDLADACAVSIRTLERICGRYFGFTPKLLMRRQRFMRSLTSWMLKPHVRWTEAMDGEYHDQAQFTREFRKFMTMNPSEYAALEHPILASFMEERARVWGSAAQALDKPAL